MITHADGNRVGSIFIRLEARLRPNIGFALRGNFGGVHAFSYNSAESEPI